MELANYPKQETVRYYNIEPMVFPIVYKIFLVRE